MEDLLAEQGITVTYGTLREVGNEYGTPYHQERHHQGEDNELLMPRARKADWDTNLIRSRERLGGLLKYYDREAA